MILSTERLSLIPVNEFRDVNALTDALWEIHSDTRTYSHRPDLVMKQRSEAIQLRDQWTEDWQQKGRGYYAVSYQGEIVGFAGVRHYILAGDAVLNTYYRFRPGVQGKGLAYEAVKAALDASAQLGKECIAIISPDNLPSVTLARRLGFRRSPDRDVSPEDQVYVLQNPQNEATANQL